MSAKSIAAAAARRCQTSLLADAWSERGAGTELAVHRQTHGKRPPFLLITIAMSENKRLVPVCIIYVDGNRLDTACEGAFRSVKVFDCLNRISEYSIAFDWSDLGNKNAKTFAFSAALSVHLGYKDDTSEAFSGEITGRKILHAEYGPSLYTVTASSPLHRLERARHRRRFENKTPSQATGDILQRYGLQADCDSFGPQKPYWDGGEQTDWDLILGLAKREPLRFIECLLKRPFKA